jgi:phosphate transport system substrate-binding protein
MKNVSVMRLAIIVLVGCGLCVLVYYSPAFFIQNETPPAVAHLRTGGTSVVAILLENRVRGVYRKEKAIEVDYDSTGSTEGVQQMIDGHYAIGFTHAALTEEQKSKAQAQRGGVLHIPVVVCAVAPIYHVKELTDKPPLNFTGEVLADIFLGKIEKWNDPALKALNPGVELPDRKIGVVHREDSSGTTFIFTDYLHGASEAWRKEVGPPGNKIKWPVGEAKPRNQGVADHVYRTADTIGYVDLLFANYGNLQYGAVQNKDKTGFIHAGPENMTAALKEQLAHIPDDLTCRLTNQSGKDSYPICGCIWAVCYQAQPGPSQKMVVDFLHWMTHDGQRYAKNMTYAPLPPELVQRVDQKLESIKAVQ